MVPGAICMARGTLLPRYQRQQARASTDFCETWLGRGVGGGDRSIRALIRDEGGLPDPCAAVQRHPLPPAEQRHPAAGGTCGAAASLARRARRPVQQASWPMPQTLVSARPATTRCSGSGCRPRQPASTLGCCSR